MEDPFRRLLDELEAISSQLGADRFRAHDLRSSGPTFLLAGQEHFDLRSIDE
jgi:hypothetical protein